MTTKVVVVEGIRRRGDREHLLPKRSYIITRKTFYFKLRSSSDDENHRLLDGISVPE